jgi:hypothetical protein
LDEAFDVAEMHVRHVRLGFHVRVDLTDATRARHRFRHAFARIALREHRLPLQIRLLDEITIHDPQTPHACTRQSLDLRRPQRAAPDDEHTRRTQARLPLPANPGKQNLPAISLLHKIRG